MKTIFRIARAELRSLFCSPVAWLILVIFAVQVGVAFGNAFDRQVQSQALGYTLWNVTGSIFTGWFGIFPGFLQYLYLYIPLLTMGLMSREYSSGSIKLLFSSPVTNTQIILGKYLSVMVFNVVLLLPLILTGVFCAIEVLHADLPLIFTGILGLYLLICAYGAIGLFMSSITQYQVVAAMGTLAVLAALNYVGGVGQNYAFVRDVTYWLSISGRADEFIRGMICSEDVLYFILIVCFFLVLSVLKLRATRTRLSAGKKWTAYGCTVVTALFIGYLSTLPQLKFYHDSSATKENTLSKASQDIVKQLKGGMKIVTYVNLLDENYTAALPSRLKDDKRRFEKYIRFKPEIKMEYVYYYADTGNSDLDFRLEGCKTPREKAEKLCKIQNLDMDLFMDKAQADKYAREHGVDLAAEGYAFIRVIECADGKRSILRMFDDMEKHPSETEISAALKRFLVKSPKVAFATGHDMRDIHKKGDRDYYRFAENLHFRQSLVNQGFDIATLSLEQAVPQDIDIVVLAEPKTQLTEAEKTHMEEYIRRGGNLFVLGDARRQEVMNPLTAQLGIQFAPGTLVQPKENDSPSLLAARFTPEAAQHFPDYRDPQRYGFTVMMPDATGLLFDASKGYGGFPVLATDSSCWNELQTTDFLDGKPLYQPQTGERKGSYPVLVALTRKVGGKEQRILVSGDADCVSNGELSKNRNGYDSSNFTLIPGSFRWMSYGEFPVDTSRPKPADTAVFVTREWRKTVRYAWYVVLPALFLVMGTTLLIRRQRQ